MPVDLYSAITIPHLTLFAAWDEGFTPIGISARLGLACSFLTLFCLRPERLGRIQAPALGLHNPKKKRPKSVWGVPFGSLAQPNPTSTPDAFLGFHDFSSRLQSQNYRFQLSDLSLISAWLDVCRVPSPN